MTGSQIIALFWERNENAIGETDAVYGRKLNAISDKILRSCQDAEESVSDTYMRAWETIPPQKRCTSLRTLQRSAAAYPFVYIRIDCETNPPFLIGTMMNMEVD